MSQLLNTTSLWNAVKDELRGLFPKDVYDTWFKPITVNTESEGMMSLVVSNEFAAFWIEDNYLHIISEKASSLAAQSIDVVIVVEDTPLPSKKTLEEESKDVAIPSRIPSSAMDDISTRRRAAYDLSQAKKKLNINPKNTFESFIVGPSNQLTHSASMAVAREPGRSFNPLFVYGDTGLGKTHLMHAIAQTIVDNKPEAKVVYCSCEKFTNEFMTAIRDNSLDKFRKRYRSVDCLLIDDVQFLEGKERTQEEFFHTFNELFESQKQVCISSDRPASEIAKLESRLISRFQWGMVTDVQAPDLETRMAIISKKAASMNYNIPADVLQFLATNITKNVRRMEGALTKVGTYVNLIKKPLDVPTAEGLVADILREEAQNQVTIEGIQKRVVEYYELRISDMASKRRPSNIAFPRQIAMYLCRILTSHSLKEIGEAFGGRDHGTVIHACKTVENIMDQDDSVKRAIDYLAKVSATA